MSLMGKILISLTGLASIAGLSYYYYNQAKDDENSLDTVTEESTDEQIQDQEEESKTEESTPSIEDSGEKNEPRQLEPEIEPDMDDLEGENLPENIEDVDEGEGWSDDKEKAKKRCGEPLDNWISKANLPTHGKNSLGRTYNGWTLCLSRNKYKSGIFSK